MTALAAAGTSLTLGWLALRTVARILTEEHR